MRLDCIFKAFAPLLGRASDIRVVKGASRSSANLGLNADTGTCRAFSKHRGRTKAYRSTPIHEVADSALSNAISQLSLNAILRKAKLGSLLVVQRFQALAVLHLPISKWNLSGIFRHLRMI